MKRSTPILAILLSFVMLLSGCGNSDLKAERSLLEAEIAALHEEFTALQADVDTLQQLRDGLIQKDEIVYILEIEISQSHSTLSFDDLVKDQMNKITLPIQVSEEYYYSTEVGETLNSDFRWGSFIMKGSIGRWKIKVINKECVNTSE